MKNSVPLLDKDFFFKQNTNVHIHLSNECPEYVGVLHRHEFLEMVYVVSGKARHRLGTHEYSVKKGDVSVIDPGEVHGFFADETCDEPFLAYDLIFTPDFVDSSCLRGGDFSALSESFLFYSIFPDSTVGSLKSRFSLIPDCGYKIGRLFELLYEEYGNQKSGYTQLMRTYIVELIIKLSRVIQSSEEGALTAKQKELVAGVMEYIQQNYSLTINTEKIASKMFFNKNYMAKLFKKETGLSIHEFVREMRIKEACRMLRTTSKTVAEVAAECGFSDMKSFYQTFRRHTGCTPKQYRNTEQQSI